MSLKDKVIDSASKRVPVFYSDFGNRAYNHAVKHGVANNIALLRRAAAEINKRRKLYRNVLGGLVVAMAGADVAMPAFLVAILPEIGIGTVLTSLAFVLNFRMKQTERNEELGKLNRDWSVVRRAIKLQNG